MIILGIKNPVLDETTVDPCGPTEGVETTEDVESVPDAIEDNETPTDKN